MAERSRNANKNINKSIYIYIYIVYLCSKYSCGVSGEYYCGVCIIGTSGGRIWNDMVREVDGVGSISVA